MTETTELVIAQASMQFNDTRAQMRSDLDRVFDQGADLIGGTEAAEDPLRGLVQARGERAGYNVTLGPGGGWTATSERHGYGGSKYVHVVDAVHKAARDGGHAARGLHLASAFVKHVGWVTIIEQHWVTGVHTGRREQWERQTRAMLTQLDVSARKHHIAFALGDVNLDLGRDWPELWSWPLKRAGATTIFDELGMQHLPDTHGGSTLDFVASWDADRRVHAKRARALPYANSDHKVLLATYEIENRG